MVKYDLHTGSRKWYVSAIAAYYSLICVACSAYYIYQDITSDCFVPYHKQVLCFLSAGFSLLYIFRPAWSLLGMLALTAIITALAMTEADYAGTIWHGFVLILLVQSFRKEPVRNFCRV